MQTLRSFGFVLLVSAGLTVLPACEGIPVVPDARDAATDQGIDVRDAGVDRRPDADGDRDASDANDGADVTDTDAMDCETACVGMCGTLPNTCPCGDTCSGGQVCGEDNRCACPASAPDKCGGACVNTQTDAAHCGGCGHGCQGGTCEAGRCQPVVIVEAQDNPTAVARFDDRVYWVNEAPALSGGAVLSAPAGGADVTPDVLIGSQNVPAAIAVDADGVFYVTREGGQVRSVPHAGGSETTYATGQNRPAAIALDATDVYWANAGTGEVMRRLKSLQAGAGLVLGDQDGPTSLAVAGGFVFFANLGTPGGTTGSIQREELPSDGVPGTPLATGEGEPVALAVDASGATPVVYYVTRGGGEVKVVSPGAAPRTLASNQGKPTAVALDATHVYWCDRSAAGTVMRIPRDESSGPEPVAEGLSYPAGVAVDANTVYVTESGNDVEASPPAGGIGRILRVAK